MIFFYELYWRFVIENALHNLQLHECPLKCLNLLFVKEIQLQKDDQIYNNFSWNVVFSD